MRSVIGLLCLMFATVSFSNSNMELAGVCSGEGRTFLGELNQECQRRLERTEEYLKKAATLFDSIQISADRSSEIIWDLKTVAQYSLYFSQKAKGILENVASIRPRNVSTVHAELALEHLNGRIKYLDIIKTYLEIAETNNFNRKIIANNWEEIKKDSSNPMSVFSSEIEDVLKKTKASTLSEIKAALRLSFNEFVPSAYVEIFIAELFNNTVERLDISAIYNHADTTLGYKESLGWMADKIYEVSNEQVLQRTDGSSLARELVLMGRTAQDLPRVNITLDFVENGLASANNLHPIPFNGIGNYKVGEPEGALINLAKINSDIVSDPKEWICKHEGAKSEVDFKLHYIKNTTTTIAGGNSRLLSQFALGLSCYGGACKRDFIRDTESMTSFANYSLDGSTIYKACSLDGQNYCFPFLFFRNHLSASATIEIDQNGSVQNLTHGQSIILDRRNGDVRVSVKGTLSCHSVRDVTDTSSSKAALETALSYPIDSNINYDSFEGYGRYFYKGEKSLMRFLSQIQNGESLNSLMYTFKSLIFEKYNMTSDFLSIERKTIDHVLATQIGLLRNAYLESLQQELFSNRLKIINEIESLNEIHRMVEKVSSQTDRIDNISVIDKNMIAELLKKLSLTSSFGYFDETLLRNIEPKESFFELLKTQVKIKVYLDVIQRKQLDIAYLVALLEGLKVEEVLP